MSPPATTSSPAPAQVPDKESADNWLVVGKGGVELGVIELRFGKPPKLTLTGDSADAKALETKLKEIGGPDGIGLDMHLPPPSGKGRGPYGTSIIKYDDKLYRNALTEELEPEFSVKQVPQLVDPMPPAKLKRLEVSHSGAKVGTLDFATTPPTLALQQTDKAERLKLQNDWDSIQKLAEVKVRYHHEKDGVQTLASASAKPGDPTYAQTVVLYMILERYYRPRYTFKLEFFE